jgi:hypothetical protein
MEPTNALTRALAKASPHLRSRALWAAAFVLAALVHAVSSPAPAPRSAEGVAAMLGAAAGGEVRPDDFVWEARGGFWTDAILGRRVVFLARRAGSAGADLYRARVRLTRDGRPLGAGGVRNLTRSPLGDDRDLVAYGHHAAYVTSAFGAVQGVTLLDLSGEGDTRETRRAGRLAAAVESWLDTGSTRGIGRTEITFGAPPTEIREEMQGDLLVLALGKEGLPAALDLRDGTLETGPSNTFTAAAQRIGHRAPALGEVAVHAARDLLGPGAAGSLRAVLVGLTGRPGSGTHHPPAPEPAAAPAPAPATATSGDWPPPALAPPIQPALAGEGAWTAGIVQPIGDAPPCFFETSIRPDPRRPAALVRLVAMDTRQVDLALAAGTDEPRSAVGLHGPGRLPDGVPAERVVAAFAGGPAAQAPGGEAEAQVEPGFVADRRVFVPPAPGLATVAVAADGRALLGVWPGEAPAPYVSVRQTPDAILGWAGPPRRPLAGDRAEVERSALGLTRSGQLVYAWSAAASAGILGRALELAGCSFAVPLAGDGAPAGLAYLRPPAPEGSPPVERAAPVTPAMSLSPAELAGRSANDLFYAVLRGAPALQAGGADGAGAFAADGGRQPSPAWLPAVQKAVVVSLGAQVRLTMFAPGRVLYRIRPGTKEPAKAVAALASALPEGEQARVVAAVGLAAGRKRKARGLIVEGAVGIPFHGDDAGALVVERGRARVLRASEVTPSPGVDATELPLTADDGKLRPEARDVGTMRPRAAACVLEDGTFFVAATTFDSDEATTTALLELGCARVVALDRGAHQAAFVHRAGTETAPEPRYEASALYAVEVPLSGRAGPLP